MTISAVSALGAGGDSAQSSKTLADNFDTFLTLLTTQLQNQDPLEPLDTNQFTEQLVQFTEVEQTIESNKNLELLVNLTQAATAGSAVSYLGRDVIADGAQASLSDGEAAWNYQLGRDAESVTLTVLDGNGNVVNTADGDRQAGDQTFTWDGKTRNGTTVPDGIYTLQVSARDANDNVITTETTVRGRVSAVDFTGSDPTLTINGVRVPVSSVREVSEQA